MKSLADALTGNFIIANLGCIGDTDYHLPPQIVKCLTVIEVDAAGAAKTRSPYHKKLVIDRPISGAAGKFTFVRNSFAGSSSLLRPRNGIVEAYGMERYFRVAGTEEVECETLPILLRRSGLGGLDFLKTDVEGLDAAIIRSCQDFLGRTLALQCELRFEPFYETEPCFHEVASLLAGHGYEVLDITFIDRWKHKTPHREAQLEGRAVWGDFLFFLKPDQLLANFGEASALASAKQVILACMLGKKNHGEFLMQRFEANIPISWRKELEPLVLPDLPSPSQIWSAVRNLFRPIELFLKHRVNRSRHVSILSGYK